MHPLFFGDSEKMLFGIYHQPAAQNIRDIAIVLCYPGPQEYMRAHWAIRRLAGLLCQTGFATFRFDYFGMGDSSGEGGEGDVSQWKADIHMAADELMEMADVREVSIVGLRLGGALAVAACNEGLHVRDLVLWDPVVSGKQYVKELQGLHSRVVSDMEGSVRDRDTDELLGFPFPSEMKKGIERIDLLNSPPCGSERVFLIVSEERKEYHDLRIKLSTDRPQFEYSLVPDGNQWCEFENFYAVLMVNDILHEIVGKLAGKNR